MKKAPGSAGYRLSPAVEAELARIRATTAIIKRDIANRQGINDPLSNERQLAARRELKRLKAEEFEWFHVEARIRAKGQYNSEPPTLAEFLLTALAATRTAEAMIGDLNERFTCDCDEFGRPRAVHLYWARTLRSLCPLLRRAIGKALKWGAVIAAVRRLF
jgi:hypothetical protein